MTDSNPETSPGAIFLAPEKLREALAGDRHRPLYHFIAPANWMNDPNGAIFWNGKYHLFYQYNPNGAFWGTLHWGHTASSDLLHWEDFPIALTPSKDGPDKNGCWSGCVVDNGGIATALYTAPGPQTVCLATSDNELINWTKQADPVITGPPDGLDVAGFPSITGDASADLRDPFVWREADRWFLLLGSGIREKGGTALLYESDDLRHWRYLHPILTEKIGIDSPMWECPILLRTGNRCLLFVCPHPEAKYVCWFAGDWEDGSLRERQRGKLDLGVYVYAANSLYDKAHDRHLLWTWVKEGRPGRIRRAAGWAGLLSLPKEYGLNENYHLTIKPAAELASLRTESRAIHEQKLTPSSENPFLEFSGDGLELEVSFSFVEPVVCELKLRASPDGSECTTLSYDSTEESLTVDGSRSSLDPEAHNLTFSGHLGPDENGVVRFRAFLDRSVLEVFLADAACITGRLYPTREDSMGVSFTVKTGSLTVHSLTAWKLASIWP